jgi:hypothetical protein
MDMDDDDEVPELTTLDEHLSNQVERQLTGLSGTVEEEPPVDGETHRGAVPITLLTGTITCTTCPYFQDTLVLARRHY